MSDSIGKMKAWREAYGRLAAVLVVLTFVSAAIFHLIEMSLPRKLSVSFLDVGQGDAILVNSPSGKQMLIDGGATNAVLRELAGEMSFFDRTIDIVVATHPDADHVTGLIPVLERYDVLTVLTSNVTTDTGIFSELTKRIQEEGPQVIVARKGDILDLGDGVKVLVLHPTDRVSNDTNDGSVSLLIIYGDHSFLLTGDLSTPYEPSLITEDVPAGVTVYKAGHHGSRTSSGEVLLSRIKPEYVVISAGRENEYGHPHQEMLERARKYAKEILSTSERGVVTFKSDGRQLDVMFEK